MIDFFCFEQGAAEILQGQCEQLAGRPRVTATTTKEKGADSRFHLFSAGIRGARDFLRARADYPDCRLREA
jgi:hypothetical protein